MFLYVSMKVISFDVGIKNLAYCLFDISGTDVSIADWKVLSLMDEEAPISFCNCCKVKEKKGKSKTKTPVESTPLCGRVAKYKKGDNFYCEKHAKAQTTYRKEDKKKVIKKMGLDELITYATSLGLLSLPKKKADILSLVETFLKEHSLEPVIEKKGAKAGDADLVVLGKNMKRIFVDSLKDVVIDHVLIENQISTLATRMKTVQGMLAQMFIMMYENIGVEFVSSANKLKMFAKEKKEESKESKTDSQKYKAHKKDGVVYCEQLLSSGKWPTDLWTNCDKKKKDDLADCFLQGVWWLKREKIIM